MKIILSLLFFSIPSLVWACPFCDAGATDVAAFIVTIFGLLTLSGIFFFVFFVRRGGLAKNQQNVEMSVLQAEGIKNEQYK